MGLESGVEVVMVSRSGGLGLSRLGPASRGSTTLPGWDVEGDSDGVLYSVFFTFSDPFIICPWLLWGEVWGSGVCCSEWPARVETAPV